MALPDFLHPQTTLRFAGPATAATLGGAAPSSQQLSFTIQRQTQTNWCWAAVSTSISQFYSALSSFTQCKVATAALPPTAPPLDCCSNPQSCDRPFFLDAALRVTGNFRNMVGQRVSFADVQKEIAAAAPIGCRVGWFDAAGQLDGSGHFMIIAGWLVGTTGTEYIDIADPIYLTSQIAYDDFAASYQSGGEWTHSYRTQPPAGGGAVVAMGISAPEVSDRGAIGA